MSAIVSQGSSNDFNGEESQKKGFRNLTSGKTALEKELTEEKAVWLTRLAADRFETLDLNMNGWREKMAKWERMSEDDWSDRKPSVDPVNESVIRDIFADQNDTLGMVSGFCDFHIAQVKDDIFGTRPWLAATPEGKSDGDLADLISKHAQWKFNQGDLEEALIDALKISTWGGTAFVKAAWHEEAEEFRRSTHVAHWAESEEPIFKVIDPETNAPMIAEAGEMIESAEELAALGVTAETMNWKPYEAPETATVYRNVCASVIDYKDISFETTAPMLDLRYTDVFVRVKMGLVDLMRKYGIPDDQKAALMGTIHNYQSEARAHREESDRANIEIMAENENPRVNLVEGFMKVVLSPGRTNRIHILFSPEINVLFRTDYLAGVTPSGMLPIFPVRVNKIPKRIFGRGYFEKYEAANNAIDRRFNVISYRDRINAHVWTAFQKSALADEGKGRKMLLDPNEPFELAEDKSIDDLIQFKAAPDQNNRTDSQMNQMLQMNQMRSGITSASQGELKGVPSANTATGTRDLMSRGSTIIKCPITEQTEDIRKIVEFAVHLLYANQDYDETFVWGEGETSSLLQIRAGDVANLRANVTLTMTQAQNAEKHQSAMVAIDIIGKWIAIPEIEKEAARPAFIQALASIGFHNADDVIRRAAVDPAGVLAIVPPELQGPVQQAFMEAGIIAPTLPGAEEAAPVSEIPG